MSSRSQARFKSKAERGRVPRSSTHAPCGSDENPLVLTLIATLLPPYGADFGLAVNASEERPVTRLGTLDYMVGRDVRLLFASAAMLSHEVFCVGGLNAWI